MADEVETHMPWCQGSHDVNGECEIAAEFRDDADGSGFAASMCGIPCDSTSISFTGFIIDPDEVTQLGQWLAEVAPLYVAGRAQVDGCGETCGVEEHYDGPQTDEDDDDDPLLCDGCGAAETSLAGVGDEWLCRACCTARGIVYGPRG